jgi:D-alanine-D-alanine ligase
MGMSKRLRLVLLYGGRSGEHEISLISAAYVLANLDPERYEVIPVGMDKSGRCFLNDVAVLRTFHESLPVEIAGAVLLPALLENGQWFTEADVIFPMVHGPLYEDGCLQGILELADVAYVGSGVLASAMGMDKDVTRRLVCDARIQSAPYALLRDVDTADIDAFCKKVIANWGWPLFVKPACMGSSVGIHKVHDEAALRHAVMDAGRYDLDVLVEAYEKGREIELAVLENKHAALSPHVSLPGEIKVHHADGYYSYAAKYQSNSTELVIPAALDPVLIKTLQEIAAEIFVRMKCSGMARVDFLVDSEVGRICFNEINTLPGFTTISMYPKLWEASGLSYGALLDELVDLALQRHVKRHKLLRQHD